MRNQPVTRGLPPDRLALASRPVGLAVALFAIGMATAGAEPAAVVPVSGVDRVSIRLSESAKLTLAVEGPAPLRLDLPAEAEKLLSPESAASWRIRPAGPAAVTPVPDRPGFERWERQFRLDPWATGEKPTITFAPAQVTAGGDLNPQPITWPPVEIRVQTAISEARPENARPVTGIEDLPVAPPPNPSVVGWQVLAGLVAVFAAALVASLIRRARTKPKPLPPGEWAVRELDRLERAVAAATVTGGVAADRAAAVLREFVERRYGLSAPKLTTTELLAECERAEWPTERTAPLRGLLERCDRSKFAGDWPAAAAAIELVVQAREWIQ